MIDTHTHIFCEDFDTDRAEVVARAKAAGVKHAILPNIDADSVERMVATAAQFPDFCSLALGLHPTEVNADYKAVLAKIEAHFQTQNFCAVGEVGLDFYWDKIFQNEQISAFETQIRWALERDLPLIIHSRAAFEECFEILKKYKNKNLRGVFHCFEGSLEQALRAIELGFFIGVGGVVTFKNSALPEIFPALPKEKLLFETDAPYLSPVPFRGKRNEPAFLVKVAEKISQILDLPFSQIVEIERKNATELFKINLQTI